MSTVAEMREAAGKGVRLFSDWFRANAEPFSDRTEVAETRREMHAHIATVSEQIEAAFERVAATDDTDASPALISAVDGLLRELGERKRQLSALIATWGPPPRASAGALLWILSGLGIVGTLYLVTKKG